MQTQIIDGEECLSAYQAKQVNHRASRLPVNIGGNALASYLDELQDREDLRRLTESIQHRGMVRNLSDLY